MKFLDRSSGSRHARHRLVETRCLNRLADGIFAGLGRESLAKRQTQLLRQLSGLFIFMAACELMYRSGQLADNGSFAYWMIVAYVMGGIGIVLLCNEPLHFNSRSLRNSMALFADKRLARWLSLPQLQQGRIETKRG